jgi:TolB-like protein/tRNA A-37 threonylcarbamoyl transferase component Bud32
MLSLARVPLPHVGRESDGELLLMSHQGHAQQQGLERELVEPPRVGEVRGAEAELGEALAVVIHQCRDAELPGEPLQLPRRRRAFLEVHEMDLDAALGEEPEDRARVGALLHAEDLDFHAPTRKPGVGGGVNWRSPGEGSRRIFPAPVTDPLERLRAALAGRYAIEREIGSGGMATVYLAEDVKHHRKVALKVMRPELAATMGSTRFLREIETAAQLQHPHILPLHDSGDADGFLYFVMPYVEGDSLRTRLARGGELPVGDAVRVLRDVADALAHAHARGVVHRDIKPDNVLLSGRHALVTDFGVAKAVSEATGRQSITTVGVPRHPRTCRRAGGRRSAGRPPGRHLRPRLPRHELLSGHPPFRGDSAQQVLAAHVTQAPTPVTSGRPAVPPALNALVMRCLEKKPADRWQTAEEVLVQIEALMTPSGGVTPTDTRPLTGVRPAPSARPKLVLAALAGVAVIALGLWAIFGRATSGVSGDKPRLVVLPPRNLGPPEQAYVADGIAEEINNRLVGLAGLEVIGRTSAERYRDTDKSPRQIGEELGVQYLLALRVGSEGPASGRRLRVSAELLRGATEAQLWGKSFVADSADDYFRVQGEIATEVASAMGVTLGTADRERVAAQPTSNAEAYDYYLRGSAAVNRGYAIADFRDAVERFTRATELDPRFALAWAGLAMAHAELYWFQADRSARRIELSQAAMDRATALAPEDPQGTGARHPALSRVPGSTRAPWASCGRWRAWTGRAEAYEWMGYVQRRSGPPGRRDHEPGTRGGSRSAGSAPSERARRDVQRGGPLRGCRAARRACRGRDADRLGPALRPHRRGRRVRRPRRRASAGARRREPYHDPGHSRGAAGPAAGVVPPDGGVGAARARSASRARGEYGRHDGLLSRPRPDPHRPGSRWPGGFRHRDRVVRAPSRRPRGGPLAGARRHDGLCGPGASGRRGAGRRSGGGAVRERHLGGSHRARHLRGHSVAVRRTRPRGGRDRSLHRGRPDQSGPGPSQSPLRGAARGPPRSASAQVAGDSGKWSSRTAS